VHYEKAQSLLPSGSDPALEVSILAGIGRSYMSLQLFEKAEKSFAQARSILEGTKNTAAKAGVIACVGELEYWTAISHPRGLQGLMGALGNSVRAVNAYAEGMTFADPHFKQALKNYDEALPLMLCAAMARSTTSSI